MKKYLLREINPLNESQYFKRLILPIISLKKQKTTKKDHQRYMKIHIFIYLTFNSKGNPLFVYVFSKIFADKIYITIYLIHFKMYLREIKSDILTR